MTVVFGTDPVAARAARRRAPAGSSVAWLIFCLLGLPPGLVYVGLATSTSIGMTLLCLGLIFFARHAHPRSQLRPVTRGLPWRFTVVLAVVIALHLLASLVHGPVDLARGLLSLVPLTLMVTGGAALADRLVGCPNADVHSGLLRAYAALCVCAAVGSTGWGPPTLAAEPWRRPVFPFFEPSAFALAFVPLLLYACVAMHGARRAIAIAAGIVFLLLINSLTLMCGVMLVALLTLRKHTLFLAAAVAVALAPQLDLSYFSERVHFGGENTNLSNLVYIQGWQMVGEAWERSGGLGIGMQQLGVRGTAVPAAEVLRYLREGEDMNLLDGSFAFAKLGADFGIFGALLAGFLVLLAVRSCWMLRKQAARAGGPAAPPALLLAHCSIATFPIELFIRSGGYFTGAGLLLASSLWVVHANWVRRAARRAPKAAPPLAVSAP